MQKAAAKQQKSSMKKTTPVSKKATRKVSKRTFKSNSRGSKSETEGSGNQSPVMLQLDMLRTFRQPTGVFRQTTGVKKHLLKQFETDQDLVSAVKLAVEAAPTLPPVRDSESVRAKKMQSGMVSLYDTATINPYIPISARGPWLITDTGAVVYDAGGYGMLGFGHAPQFLLDQMAKPYVQANIMTPSPYQRNFVTAMRREIGNTRGGNDRGQNCPYQDFVALNSGSESVTFAMRVADTDAKIKTAPDGPAAGKKSCLVSLATSFHGRTERPAAASDSSRKSYLKYLKSYENVQTPLFTIPVNDEAALEEVFEQIKAEGYHPEMMLMEATQGEGNPGVRLSRSFYDKARKLTKDFHSLLLIDSIQAGFRAQGHLSLMDYPGFQDADAPDFETFSKALNGGQYPMSTVAFAPGVSDIYKQGLYGNTMTGNPRALAVATTTLNKMTPAIKQNIVKQGEKMVQNFEKIKVDYSNMVESASGSGLLNALHLKPEIQAYGSSKSVEFLARRNGLGIIHGGKNALRYTPHFRITDAEVDLIDELTRQSLDHYAAVHKIATKL